MVRGGDHHRGLGARVDLTRRLGARALAGTVVERAHAQVEREAGLTGADGLQIGLQAVQQADLLVDQLTPAAGQPLKLLVGGRHRGDFLQHVAGQRDVIAEPKQFQDLAPVDSVRLGRGGKDFLVAGELEIVDAVEPEALPKDHPVERPGVTVVAFHGDGDRALLAETLDTPEEFAEPGGGVRDVELGQELAIGGADGDAVAG